MCSVIIGSLVLDDGGALMTELIKCGVETWLWRTIPQLAFSQVLIVESSGERAGNSEWPCAREGGVDVPNRHGGK
jgi:hypothetical protein